MAANNSGSFGRADPSFPPGVRDETAALNERDLAEYCRRKCLCREQIQRWWEAAVGASRLRDLIIGI